MRFLTSQANWQTALSMSPDHAAIGLLLAACVNFVVPFGFALCLGVGYLALCAAYHQDLLTPTQIHSGTVRFLKNNLFS